MLGDELGPPGIATPVSANRTQIAASRRVPPFGPDGRKRSSAVSHTDGILPKQARARSTVSREAGFLECLVKELRFAFLPDDSPGVGTGASLSIPGIPFATKQLCQIPTQRRVQPSATSLSLFSLYSPAARMIFARDRNRARNAVSTRPLSVSPGSVPHVGGPAI